MVRILFPPARSLRTIGSVTASPTTIMGRCRTDRRGQQIQIAVAVSNLYRATEVLRSSGARPVGLRIDRPVVFEKLDPVIERDGFAPIAIDVGDQARALSEKVLCVKIEDCRQIYQPILGIEADVAIFDNEGARRTIQLAIEGRSGKRRTRQSRAAYDHAIEREVHARVADGADHVVLEAVKRGRSAADLDATQGKRTTAVRAHRSSPARRHRARPSSPTHCTR